MAAPSSYDDSAPTEYESMTVSQLKSLLDSMGISYPTNSKKADLIALIEGGV